MFKYAVLSLALMTPGVSMAQDHHLEQLKAKLIRVAKSYAGDDAKLIEARQALDPLVEKIAPYNVNLTAAAQLPQLLGGWKEVWSDERQPGPPNFVTDRSQVYQVIDANGFFYNFSDTKTPMGTFTGALRGVWEAAEGVALNIEFTNTKSRPSPLADAANLTDLVASFETEISQNPGPVAGGPIGIKGILENVYVDDELRIAVEKDVEQNIRALFILEKTDVVIK